MRTQGPLSHCAVVLVLVTAGCGADFGLPPNDRPRPTLDLTVVDLDAEASFQENDANDLFELAQPVAVGPRLEVIRGNVEAPDDVDVYDFGPVNVGDRVAVAMSASDTLKGAIAVFDDAGATLLVNDSQNAYLDVQGPFIDVVFPRPSRRCFIAVTATSGFQAHGEYVLGATIEPRQPAPGPRSDTVLLDFAGSRGVRIASRAAVDVPRFNAADIDPRYAGASGLLQREIVRRVRADFAGLDVAILSTAEGARADGGTSRVHFGAVDQALLGVAEDVDEFDLTRGQRAIVFVESFAALMRLNPSPTEMAQALANVASHEIGHLLGLVHTADAADIMDVTASLDQLLDDQTFGKSPIYRLVFPIGYQDSSQLLLDSVGGDAIEFYQALKQQAAVRSRVPDPTAPAARAAGVFGSCGLSRHPQSRTSCLAGHTQLD